MTETNFPSAMQQPNQPPRRDSRNLIYGVLIVALLGTWGYMLYDKNKASEKDKQQIAMISETKTARDSMMTEFQGAMTRLDSLTGAFNDAQGVLKERNNEIAGLKSQIKSILSKRNATEAELNKARQLINELNGKIETYVAEIEQLKGENQQLTATNVQVMQERDQVRRDLDSATVVKTAQQKKIEEGSTLNANNITIKAIDERRSGKEKVKTIAKRIDKLRISFDVFNRIAQSGKTDVYVCIKAPDGTPISVAALGSGVFTANNEGEKPFTSKVSVEYQQGESKHVEFDWKQNSKFQVGEYLIEIYHNGFKIGSNTISLRKGGLFS
jgi:hypothetical protein